jgi:hypothetical protein
MENARRGVRPGTMIAPALRRSLESTSPEY